MEVREEVIEVLQGTERIQKRVTMEYTRHGPVVARRDGKAYVFAIPYYDQIGMADQTYRMVVAKNLKEMKDALGHASTHDAEHHDRDRGWGYLLCAERPSPHST